MSFTKIAAALALCVIAPAGAYYAYTSGSHDGAATENVAKTVVVTIASSNGAHKFTVETAKTESEQQRGLMFRTHIDADAGMLFAPYPPDGGPPKEASFWMKNTPSPLDIIFIRKDGTIATIAENTLPLSETPIPSGEPVAAVLEINGGRSAELGIAEGDKVTWPGHGAN
ncbi:MAG: hypothetical protein JWN66_1873 [Sphingomonas bacterium]|uniref:DUF192 domain-containing protein n=1 Tax=Sphingomonas bacterium TaxID=1895847 RepID=UPI002623A3C8|nr:DUF192 domain-containing protein [Sphingomonas bacterium]MDB5704757.1 hypothetical protein [Sphingomonas bacterium]